MSARLQALWYRDAPPPWLLRPLAWLFGRIVRGRHQWFGQRAQRRRPAGCPVIVVGNLTVGGSGKTPLVLWLVQRLRLAGRTPGIVLRGYGGSVAARGGVCRVEPDSDPAQVGDEALLLRRRAGVPVAIGADRVSAARLLHASGVDLIVSDDGLQHLALARDCELIVVDGERGLGNGWLLPAGPLREPASRLASVDAVIVNGTGRFWSAMSAGTVGPVGRAGRPLLMRLEGDCLEAVDGSDRTMPLRQLAGQRVHAVAGIGHPQRFFARLRAAGIEVQAHPFADHHRFAPADLQFGDELPVLMTEKDAVKCRPFAASRCWYLPVGATLEAADATLLLDLVQQAIDSPARRRTGD